MAVIGINYTGANYDYDSEFDKNRKVDWDSLTAKQKWEWDYLDIDPIAPTFHLTINFLRCR